MVCLWGGGRTGSADLVECAVRLWGTYRWCRPCRTCGTAGGLGVCLWGGVRTGCADLVDRAVQL